MKSARQILLGGMLAAAVMTAAPSAKAQEINGTPGSPDATVTIDGKQIPPPPMPFGGVIKESRHWEIEGCQQGQQLNIR